MSFVALPISNPTERSKILNTMRRRLPEGTTVAGVHRKGDFWSFFSVRGGCLTDITFSMATVLGLDRGEIDGRPVLLCPGGADMGERITDRLSTELHGYSDDLDYVSI